MLISARRQTMITNNSVNRLKHVFRLAFERGYSLIDPKPIRCDWFTLMYAISTILATAFFASSLFNFRCCVRILQFFLGNWNVWIPIKYQTISHDFSLYLIVFPLTSFAEFFCAWNWFQILDSLFCIQNWFHFYKSFYLCRHFFLVWFFFCTFERCSIY